MALAVVMLAALTTPVLAQDVASFLNEAAFGDANAQFSLGTMYDYGKGVPEDDAEAAKWYRLAAEQGDAGAQYSLGVMYGLGNGVPQDYVRSHMWFNLAAAQGNEGAGETIASRKRFADTIQSRGYAPKRTLKSRGFEGIRLRRRDYTNDPRYGK